MIQHSAPAISGVLAAMLAAGAITVGSIGQKRKEAIVRVFAFAWLLLIGIVYNLFTTLFFIIAILDVLWQLVANADGFGVDGFVSDWIHAWVYWYADITAYILSGRNSPNWLPRRSEGAR